MERLPVSLSIALWIVGSLWALAIISYLFGVSLEWLFPVFALALLSGFAEWVIRRKPK
jgi:hypothetical protein